MYERNEAIDDENECLAHFEHTFYEPGWTCSRLENINLGKIRHMSIKDFIKGTSIFILSVINQSDNLLQLSYLKRFPLIVLLLFLPK